jgi:hypothetical protein
LRFAPLDLDLMRTTIADDLSDEKATDVAVEPGIGVTCLDQIRSGADVIKSGVKMTISGPQLAKEIAAAAGLPLVLEARGAQRSAVNFPRHNKRHHRGLEPATVIADGAGAHRRQVTLASNNLLAEISHRPSPS